MLLKLICLLAVISTALCLFLWFRDVRRIMKEQRSTVESARRQLASSRKRAAKARGAPEAAVLERSESIYRQAVDHYNRTLHKPWVYPPAALMGFRMIQNGGERP